MTEALRVFSVQLNGEVIEKMFFLRQQVYALTEMKCLS